MLEALPPEKETLAVKKAKKKIEKGGAK